MGECEECDSVRMRYMGASCVLFRRIPASRWREESWVGSLEKRKNVANDTPGRRILCDEHEAFPVFRALTASTEIAPEHVLHSSKLHYEHAFAWCNDRQFHAKDAVHPFFTLSPVFDRQQHGAVTLFLKRDTPKLLHDQRFLGLNARRTTGPKECPRTGNKQNDVPRRKLA